MVDIDRMGLTNRPSSNRKVGLKPIYERKSVLAEKLNLSQIYAPRVYSKSLVEIQGKDHFVVQLPKGQIVGVHPAVNEPQRFRKTRFYNLDEKIRIPDFRKRVVILSDLLYRSAEIGICKDSLKALKRLSVIGFSCPMKRLLEISGYIYRKLYMGRSRKKTRRPDYNSKGCMYPSLTGSWKCVLKGLHTKVQTWTWKAPPRGDADKRGIFPRNNDG